MTQTYIFIDGSYFCFYRYHALLTWWKNAYPEQTEVIQDPYSNTLFVEKFKKTFNDNITKIPKGLKIPKNTNYHIIVGKDCKRQNIWRQELYPKYKANRDNESFMGGPFFKMVYEEELFIKAGATAILSHPKLEADDCIALSVKHLLKSNDDIDIYIITSDKDYLQLARHNVHIFNLAFKDLTEQKSCNKDSECDLFCKIIMGDTSDNIPSVFPKCGPKTALKYFENKELLQKKLKENEEYKKQYELNKTIIDFDYIPQQLQDEFLLGTNKL